MTVEELRDILQTLLVDDLGAYANTRGASTPAIVIRSQGEQRPNDRQVIGLEVVIRRIPKQESLGVYGGANHQRTWQVFLVQHDPNGQPWTLQSAIDKIGKRFVETRFTPINLPKSQGAREQVSAKIRDFTDFDREEI